MKENIKKNLLFTILVFLSLTIHAQKYQGSIVDAESQQSLPFATIYVDAFVSVSTLPPDLMKL